MDDEETLWGFKRKQGGGIQRTRMPTCQPSPVAFDDGVASKDVKIDGTLWARIFLPAMATLAAKKPVVLYFHGGGFCYLSVSHVWYSRFLHSLAKSAAVVVIAVEYRLAPEHRLPAAFDDAFTSLAWVRSQASGTALSPDPWLLSFADFSQCFIAGDSAGANIVHNLSLRINDTLGHGDDDKVRIVTHILIHPFFGGSARTRTEELMPNDPFVPLRSADWLWRHALPEGSDRDHPACNPLSLPISVYRNARLPKTLVIVARSDPLLERQLGYYHLLQEVGVDVQLLSHDGSHGFFLFQMEETDAAASFVRDLSGYLHAANSSSKL